MCAYVRDGRPSYPPPAPSNDSPVVGAAPQHKVEFCLQAPATTNKKRGGGGESVWVDGSIDVYVLLRDGILIVGGI